MPRAYNADGPRDVGNVAVLVGLHPRPPRRDPAAQRRVREAVREVADRPAARAELLLQVRPEDARLHTGEPRCLVDVEDAVHPGQVHREHRAGLVRQRLEAAGDVRAAAEGDEHAVGLQDRGHDRLDLGLGPGADDRVGNAADVAGPVADKVAQALAARVDHAVQRLDRHVRGTDGVVERRAQLLGKVRVGDLEVAKRDRPGGDLLEVEPQMLPDERGEAGLIVVGERQAVVAPSPPLHCGHGTRQGCTAARRSES